MSTSAIISIEVEALKLTSAERQICFRPFSFEFTPSIPHICVTGPSGSGKTTFFKSMIKRFVDDWHEFDTPEISISIRRNNLDFYQTNGRIGYAAQRPFFIAHKTVRQNITIPFHWSGKTVPISSAVDEVLADFHLDRIVDQAAYKLSAGEGQRLNLARMFIAGPEIAIIDECFSAMDEDLAKTIAGTIIEKYAARSRILVTGHRASDLVKFGPAMLSFQYSDTSEPRHSRTVEVKYNGE